MLNYSVVVVVVLMVFSMSMVVPFKHLIRLYGFVTLFNKGDKLSSRLCACVSYDTEGIRIGGCLVVIF